MDWSRVAYHELCKQITTHCEVAGVLPSRTIVLDIETTGLEPEYDEILQLSILDADTSDILYNHYFQPFLISEWAEAQAAVPQTGMATGNTKVTRISVSNVLQGTCVPIPKIA